MQRSCCLLKVARNVATCLWSRDLWTMRVADASSCRQSTRSESLFIFLSQEDSVGCRSEGERRDATSVRLRVAGFDHLLLHKELAQKIDMRTIDQGLIAERREGTMVKREHNVMDARCQMTLAHPSISCSMRRLRSHSVREEGGKSAPCPCDDGDCRLCDGLGAALVPVTMWLRSAKYKACSWPRSN